MLAPQHDIASSSGDRFRVIVSGLEQSGTQLCCSQYNCRNLRDLPYNWDHAADTLSPD